MMFILPYVYHQRKLPHMTIYEYSILTLGGKELWKEDDSLCIINDILEPNGLSIISQSRYIDVILCKLDKTKLDMSEYYNWNEIELKTDIDIFCWRKYYIIVSNQLSAKPTIWLPFPDTERLGPYSSHELFRQILDTTNTS